jgi:hypothetical protein
MSMRIARCASVRSSPASCWPAIRRPPNAPGAHVVHWNGDFPCRADGTPIQGISHQAGAFDLGHGLKATHSFSSKPDGGTQITTTR